MTDTFKSFGEVARHIVERHDHRHALLNAERELKEIKRQVLASVYLLKWFKADHTELYNQPEVRDLVEDILATLKPRREV